MTVYAVNEPLLTIKDVSLNFGNRVVLRDVNAEIRDITRPGVEQGQVVCFLGASGIGKTRLSRIIAGLDAPTTGSVKLRLDQPVKPGRVGMVPQNYPLFEFMTVRQNLELARRQASLDGVTTLQQHVETFELKPYLELYPGQLSGGTRQRVSIVQQLLCSEHYIVMDEPFSGLDLKMKQRACEMILRVSLLHTLNTIIIVTHDVTEGMSVADTVWLMGVDKTSAGQTIPGARIVERYDLAAEGLCWAPNLMLDAKFQARVADVKQRFLEVSP